jgi:hypothetical protein
MHFFGSISQKLQKKLEAHNFCLVYYLWNLFSVSKVIYVWQRLEEIVGDDMRVKFM